MRVVITVEEAKGIQTELDVVEGMQFDRAAMCRLTSSPTRKKMVADLDSPYILIHEKKLSTLQPLLPLLEAVVAVRPAAADCGGRRGRRGRWRPWWSTSCAAA